MKLIDKTPFRDEETREISLQDRIKATMKFGLAWYGEIQAQDKVAAVLNSNLGRGFTLMQNCTLPGTQIILPLILVGTAGVYVIYVTTLRGLYRAKGDEWGTIDGDTFTPAKENLLVRAARMARALQSYLDKQGFQGMLKVEAILMASDPGMHIESVRPLVRIVMSDALERFAVSMQQAQAAFSSEAVQNIVHRIETPKPIAKPGSSETEEETEEETAFTPITPTGSGAEISAATFTFEEPKPQPSEPAPAAEKRSAVRKSPVQPAVKFSTGQMITLGILFFAMVIILIAFILIMVFNA